MNNRCQEIVKSKHIYIIPTLSITKISTGSIIYYLQSYLTPNSCRLPWKLILNVTDYNRLVQEDAELTGTLSGASLLKKFH